MRPEARIPKVPVARQGKHLPALGNDDEEADR